MIYAHNNVPTFDFVSHKINGVFGAYHMTGIIYIYIYIYILSSSNNPLSYILTSRGSLSLPASDTRLNTRNMGAYILCDRFLSCSAFSAGLVLVLRTTSDISSNPERDKRPTWEKTRLSRIHCYISVY